MLIASNTPSLRSNICFHFHNFSSLRFLTVKSHIKKILNLTGKNWEYTLSSKYANFIKGPKDQIFLSWENNDKDTRRPINSQSKNNSGFLFLFYLFTNFLTCWALVDLKIMWRTKCEFSMSIEISHITCSTCQTKWTIQLQSVIDVVMQIFSLMVSYKHCDDFISSYFFTSQPSIQHPASSQWWPHASYVRPDSVTSGFCVKFILITSSITAAILKEEFAMEKEMLKSRVLLENGLRCTH